MSVVHWLLLMMPSFLVIFHCGVPWHSFQHMLKTSRQAPETPTGGWGSQCPPLAPQRRPPQNRAEGIWLLSGAGAQDLGYPAVPEVPGLLLTSGKEGGKTHESTPGKVTGFRVMRMPAAHRLSPSGCPALLTRDGGPRLDSSEASNRVRTGSLCTEEGNTSPVFRAWSLD